ncbi:MAG: hypothetical protein KatS3mg105_1843 [Gemmatales bacterium]|nr:MAG: hypothetical protein KatS3mg105_1843 [Gemmatales bacterium]
MRAGWTGRRTRLPRTRCRVVDHLPPPHPERNQQLANRIAALLENSGNLHHYRVHIRYTNGLVELSGYVADEAQRDEVLRLVQGVPGVYSVRDRLTVTSVRPVQAIDRPPSALPEPDRAIPLNNGTLKEPYPIYRAPAPSMYHVNKPPMPPYAWPTYAPYNNYSRVAYPTLYPYHSWPFIGPFYPFPKVPLGWRSISLEWQDGHWWYGKHTGSHDWWRLRYW